MWVSCMGPHRSHGVRSVWVVCNGGGLPETLHLVYHMLLDEGNRRVDPEEAKDAGEAILYLHGALIVAICEVLDKVWSNKGNRGAVLARGARVVRVFVR